MVPHKHLVIASFVLAGIYFGYVIIDNYDSILTAQREFFDMAPAGQAKASTAVIALVPLAYFAVAFAVHRDSKFWPAAVPAVIAALLTLGVASLVLVAYLVLYYFVYSPRDGSRRASR